MQYGLVTKQSFFYRNDIFTQGKFAKVSEIVVFIFPLRKFLGSWRKKAFSYWSLTVCLSFRPLRQVKNELNTAIRQYIRQLLIQLFQNVKKEVLLKFQWCSSLTQKVKFKSYGATHGHTPEVTGNFDVSIPSWCSFYSL